MKSLWLFSLLWTVATLTVNKRVLTTNKWIISHVLIFIKTTIKASEGFNSDIKGKLVQLNTCVCNASMNTSLIRSSQGFYQHYQMSMKC